MKSSPTDEDIPLELQGAGYSAIVILDKGTSGHFLPASQCLLLNSPVYNVKPSLSPVHVTLSDTTTMVSTHEGNLMIAGLSEKASKCYIFDKMTAPLLSIGQFCGDRCYAIFADEYMWIVKDNIAIIKGKKDYSTNLWTDDLKNPTDDTIPGPNPLQFLANAAIAKETVGKRMEFLHACAGYPVLSTWCKAIDAGYYTTWPGLTSKLVRKHFWAPSKPTVKGHLDQQRKNLRSTKPKPNHHRVLGDEETPDMIQPTDNSPRSNFVFTDFQQFNGQVYTNQTGNVLVLSEKGNQYLMVLYAYDGNSIEAEPIKSRSSEDLTSAYHTMHDKLTSQGL